MKESELPRSSSKQRNNKAIMEEVEEVGEVGEESYSSGRQVESEMREYLKSNQIHSEIKLIVTDFMKEQMVVEGGRESDTDMDRDLVVVEQKQYGSRRSLFDTEHSCLTVGREEGDDDGQEDQQ